MEIKKLVPVDGYQATPGPVYAQSGAALFYESAFCQPDIADFADMS